MPTYQEILEGICRHRANRLPLGDGLEQGFAQAVQQKMDEVEWALQALAEKLRDADPT